MNCYVIGYDLRKPGRNYEKLFEAIMAFPAWCHALESMWFVKTRLKSEQILDKLLPNVDSNDQLYVGGVTSDATWYNLEKEASDWLQENL